MYFKHVKKKINAAKKTRENKEIKLPSKQASFLLLYRAKSRVSNHHIFR